MELLRRLADKTLIIAAILGMAVLIAPQALAQTDCVWENVNCTPTPTITPTPTGTLPATPPLGPDGLNPIEYGIPTSIPTLSFPPVPSPLSMTPFPAPSPISIEITPIPTPSFPTNTITASDVISLSTINTSLVLSYTTPLTLDLSITGTNELTGSIGSAVGDFSGWLEDGVISYTDYLTGEIANLEGTQTITVVTAPVWYAPALPRPMADVGWTFEQLTDPSGATLNFTVSSWAGFFGYVSTIPFQFVKTLWQLVAYLGPLGLFLGWLLIMFVIVLVIHTQVFIVKFLITILRLVVRLVELLGEWVPTGG